MYQINRHEKHDSVVKIIEKKKHSFSLYANSFSFFLFCFFGLVWFFNGTIHRVVCVYVLNSFLIESKRWEEKKTKKRLSKFTKSKSHTRTEKNPDITKYLKDLKNLIVEIVI